MSNVAIFAKKTGTRGSIDRSLSRSMLRSGSFFMDLFIDCEANRHIVFQSSKMQNPTHQNATVRRVGIQKRPKRQSRGTTGNSFINMSVPHTTGSLGECQLCYENNAAECKSLLKSLSYTVPEYVLRASVIAFSV